MEMGIIVGEYKYLKVILGIFWIIWNIMFLLKI